MLVAAPGAHAAAPGHVDDPALVCAGEVTIGTQCPVSVKLIAPEQVRVGNRVHVRLIVFNPRQNAALRNTRGCIQLPALVLDHTARSPRPICTLRRYIAPGRALVVRTSLIMPEQVDGDELRIRAWADVRGERIYRMVRVHQITAQLY